MHTDLARRSHALLKAAVELSGGERAAFVAAACANDPQLHGRVAELLAAVDRSGEFLETPALGGRSGRGGQPSPCPTSIGGYTIVRVIGVGGMATVFEALQQQPQRRVALKVMRDMLIHTSAIARFRYETEVLARLQHPGIAQIFEAGACDDGRGVSTPFFAMEYISDARTITTHASERGLTLVERLRLFASVCDAVHHGHQHGVIHRDLKPGNVLVDADGRPKVIDFGVARPNDPSHARITRQTDFGQLIGTLNYMSPEQCAGADDLDIRTDVYSLGVILYELVCGRLPHDLAHTPLLDAVRIVRDSPPARPASFDVRLRGDIDAIVMKAMDKDRERRYPAVAALAADVRRFLNDETVEARPPTIIHQCRLFVRRHRPLVAAASAVLFVVVAGAVLSAGFAYRASIEAQRRADAEAKALRERDAARWQAYVANIASAIAALGANEFQQLRTRLDAAPVEHRGWEWSFLLGMSERGERTMIGHTDMIHGFAASRDGTRVATGCLDGIVRVWDVASGDCVASIDEAFSLPVYAIAFSPDGEQLVAGSADRTVRVFDARTGAQACLLGEHDHEVWRVSWGGAGVIASASSDGVARLWNREQDGTFRTLDDQPGGISGLEFSTDGATLATWNSRGALWLRDGAARDVRQRLDFYDEIESFAMTADGGRVAAGGRDSRVVVWSAAGGEVLHEMRLTADAGTIVSLAFSPDGERMAAGRIQRDIVYWRTSDALRLGQLRGHEEAVSALWFTPDGERLLSASWDRTIRLWGVTDESAAGQVTSLSGHGDEVYSTAYSPDGSILASGGQDRFVRLWDPVLGLPLGVLLGHKDTVSTLAFSPDARLIASGSYDGTIRLWNAHTGAPLTTLDEREFRVWSLAFSPDGSRIAAGGDDGVLRIWDSKTRKLLRTCPGHTRRITRLAYSPDGARIATSSRDHSVRIWDANTGQSLKMLAGHESDVFAVLFSHDGRRLYSGARDQTVRVWDSYSGKCERILGGHGQFVTCLALSPDGSRLAAGSWFGELLLWDLPTHDIVTSFKGHAGAIRAIEFAPNGRFLATAAYDGEVRLFESAAAGDRHLARREADAHRLAALDWLARFAAGNPPPEQLLESVDADRTLEAAERAWIRKLILMRALAPAAQP